MHRIDTAPVSPLSLKPVSAAKPRDAIEAAVSDPVLPRSAAPEQMVPKDSTLDPGLPPVDDSRVAMIRKAIEQGHYPVLPARVADAVIAAGLLLRTGK